MTVKDVVGGIADAVGPAWIDLERVITCEEDAEAQRLTRAVARIV